jgi:hypothetical protein
MPSKVEDTQKDREFIKFVMRLSLQSRDLLALRARELAQRQVSVAVPHDRTVDSTMRACTCVLTTGL